MLADYGVDDQVFKEVLGVDADLDSAIGYYLDIDTDSDDDEDWDE